ncbi:DMT family transporter [Nakamurella endophytica]|uniref:ABC transporter permease n=1 Tax=Nakamurella endophytica TaxID=1748367 RepID=A0A917STZ6_9ACTN|nr:EamA family transporter [Nakamurella endophytica]GGL97733.1 ABC transporter permease [Nakamurella endophytica]
MEGTVRWVAATAIAPVAWGSNYYVTHEFLPAGHPLWGGVLRALPAGVLLWAVRRRRPSGPWWWRSAVLGTLNVGAFFALIFVAAQLLPSGVAATVMATSPVVMMLLAWILVSERPAVGQLAGAALGIAGVLLLLTGSGEIPAAGVAASVGAMALSSLGYVLTKRWGAGVDVLSLTSWQLVAGAVVLLPAAVLVEGAPPALDGAAVAGFGYVTVVATAVAFAAWFTGLRHLPAGTVGLVGLLNPVTGVLLGTALAGELLTARQVGGLVLVLAGVLAGQPVLRAALRRGRRPGTVQCAGAPAPEPDVSGQDRPDDLARPHRHTDAAPGGVVPRDLPVVLHRQAPAGVRARPVSARRPGGADLAVVPPGHRDPAG